MIVSLKEMLQEAMKGQYAVGAFNCLSLENVQGAIQAAEELNAPIIIQLAEVQCSAFADGSAVFAGRGRDKRTGGGAS